MQRRIPTTPVHLRAGGTSVVLDPTTPGLPAIVHWGADLGPLPDSALDGLAAAARPQRVSGGLDATGRLTLIPQESAGWQATPGLVGSRDGRDFSTALTTVDLAVHDGRELVVTAIDDEAGLTATVTVRLDDAGLLHQRVALTNTGAGVFEVAEVAAQFLLPSTATEVLDTTGRHLRERHPQRHALTVGRYDRESRRGRPGPDATLLLAAGTPGFGFERGLVHAVHLAWSGGFRLSVERTPTGTTFLRAAELLAPGEIRLDEGETYETPDAIGSWGDGLTELSARFHRALRARPQHPSTPRPVTLNTWEAVYFEHDLDRLTALAEAGARVGAERFVLDDGWFRGRRDDTTSLGDWYVDETVWPDGLRPLADRVRALGMEFGLWVEPEMISPDSDLARAHPDWILGAGDRLPPSARQQQVLDLSNPDAAAYLLERLDSLVADIGIAYLKWDHNRDLLEAGSRSAGRAAVHANVVALYALFDELKRRHPGLEIESCASGGARVDLGILDHTDRIWTSDCIDPIERLTIQKYTGLVVPYELMGAHVSGPVSHSTGRAHSLALRGAVALPGHFGIEWDISGLDDASLEELAGWVAAHKWHRDLLHTGTAVFADLGASAADASEPAADVRGVVAVDRSRALYSYVQVTTGVAYPPAPVPLPGLDPSRIYRVALASPTSALTPALGSQGQSQLAWASEPIEMSGLALGTAGLRPPVLFPEHAVLIEVVAVE